MGRIRVGGLISSNSKKKTKKYMEMLEFYRKESDTHNGAYEDILT